MADTAGLRARNVAFWAQAAPGWIRHADRQDELGRPLGAAAMDWLNPQPGERVLDVGCGCGGTTAELAAAVAPIDGSAGAGQVGAAVGVDLAESMVAAAAERFPGERYPGLRFVAADIETIDVVPSGPFDAAFSRMALMLLADPVAGCAAIRRALRPGGRLAATVFRDAGSAGWLFATVLGAAPHLGPLLPLPVGEEPGPFAFADATRVRRILTDAGFSAVSVEPRDVIVRAPADDATAEWLIEIGPAGAAYRQASPPQQAAARAGVATLLARFREPASGYELPTGCWLITATVGGVAR